MPISQHPQEEWKVTKGDHPGSSEDEIAAEPDWPKVSNEQYPGYKNNQRRRPGFVQEQEHENEDYREQFQQDKEVFLRAKRTADSKSGRLINWQDADISLYHPEGHPFGWRYVLNFTEDEIRNQQDWPANIKQRERKRQQEEDARDGTKDEQQDSHDEETDGHAHQADHEEGKAGKDEGDGGDKEDGQSEYDSLRSKYTPAEVAFLRAVRDEKDYMYNLETDDGKGQSTMTVNRTDISLAEDDQFTPDNWIPRSKELIRLTGKHPLNAEPDLRRLFDAGLITPNEIHYVRSHGAVPRLL
ncbi:hypothetical protein PRZ48_007431 [Zasmidium cellare]|uniref:Uncharacterized protein n=1 Tax=Zasmidium cellare TaxID=395010 RepID=A0ABR0EJB4_ZASCE|nr:hypothetical protein PRZ48_007431 [Zasmidium cellare]